MPITATFDDERQEIHAVASGPVGYQDIAGHLLQQRELKSLHYGELVDGREAQATFAPADARRIVDLLKELSAQGPIGRKAVIASSDYAFGLTRMIETLTEPFCKVRAFRSEDEARVWLRLAQK